MPPSTLTRLTTRPRTTTATIAVILTLWVAVFDLLGMLKPLELWCFDQRVANCQLFVPQPTDELLHVDIRDELLREDTIGRWPWDRWKLAAMIDELRLAGAKTIAIDIAFFDRQQYQTRDGVPIDSGGDMYLAEALANHGSVIIAYDPGVDAEIVPEIADSAAALGLVKYPRSDDGVSRFVSLVYEREDGGEQHFHIALQLAALQRGATADDITMDRDRVAIKTTGGEINIPTDRLADRQAPENVGLRNDLFIPWFGKSGVNAWETMYDWPAHKRRGGAAQHPRMLDLWLAANAANQLEFVDGNMIADMLRSYSDEFLPEANEKFIALNLSTEERLAFTKMVRDDLKKRIATIDPQNATAIQQQDLDYFNTLSRRLDQIQKRIAINEKELPARRAALKEVYDGKAVIIGFAATAAYDEVPTPLHPKAPGPMVLGAVFNGIMTGELWRAAPRGTATIITLVLGLLVGAITAMRGPLFATIAAAVIASAYILINGVVLFDAGNLVVGMAGPLTAVLVVWAGGTLCRFIIERVERARVESRFRSYVDPTLVDYVLAHPEKQTLDGEQRELTVVFTDLAGFTTLSEKLKEGTVPLLSEYFERMVPLVRKHGGYVDKFLGDGMMFFYGAPVEMTDSSHAIHAVTTVLAMLESLSEFNGVLRERGLPEIGMRAGIGSGEMTVGDSGPADASDYTVLGDNVNLTARLESANKATDTQVLINQRCADLLGDAFALRPIANLLVVGKTQGEFVYEPLGRTEDVDEALKKKVQATRAFVEAFREGNFSECLARIDDYENSFAPDKLTKLYRATCERHLANPPGDAFDGCIELTEK